MFGQIQTSQTEGQLYSDPSPNSDFSLIQPSHKQASTHGETTQALQRDATDVRQVTRSDVQKQTSLAKEKQVCTSTEVGLGFESARPRPEAEAVTVENASLKKDVTIDAARASLKPHVEGVRTKELELLKQCFLNGLSWPLFTYFHPFLIIISIIQIEKA